MTQFASRGLFIRRLFLTVTTVLAFIIFAGCSYDSGSLGQISCDSQSDCSADAECIGGYCVIDSDPVLDAGPNGEDEDTNNGIDGGTDADDVQDIPCIAESEQSFCARHGVECGEFTGPNNCEVEQTVTCEQFVSCSGNQECSLAEENSELDTNICGCPCEIGGTCYADGAPNSSEQCSICDPTQASDEFSDAPDDHDCTDDDPCTLSSCLGGSCNSTDRCSGADDECGCESCTDCTEETGFYDDGPAYDCCDGDQLCTCQDREWRIYSCAGTGCEYSIDENQSEVDITGCDTCPDGEICDGDVNACIEDLSCNPNDSIGAGAGDIGDPFQICAAHQLDYMDVEPSSHFILTESVDLNDHQSFEGLGTFSGHFDGQGFTIENLYVYDEDNGRSDVGFFSAIAMGGTIENLTLQSVFVRGESRVGALAGTNSGTINNVLVDDGTVLSEANDLGGLVGRNESIGDIFRSGTNVSIENENSDRVGGFVGSNQGHITESRALGEVADTDWYGNEQIGGFVGRNEGTIENCYAIGDVRGEEQVGGFVGRNHDGNISNSYAYGEAVGNDDFSGFVGLHDGNGVIENSFANSEFNDDDVHAINIRSEHPGQGNQFGEQNRFTDEDWDFDVPGIWTMGPDERPILSWEQ